MPAGHADAATRTASGGPQGWCEVGAACRVGGANQKPARRSPGAWRARPSLQAPAPTLHHPACMWPLGPARAAGVVQQSPEACRSRRTQENQVILAGCFGGTCCAVRAGHVGTHHSATGRGAPPTAPAMQASKGEQGRVALRGADGGRSGALRVGGCCLCVCFLGTRRQGNGLVLLVALLSPAMLARGGAVSRRTTL